MKRYSGWRVPAALVLLIVSFCLLLLAAGPVRTTREIILLDPARLAGIGDPLEPSTANLAEARRVVVEWAPVMRVGDQSRLQLSLEPAKDDETAPSQTGGASPDPYDRYWIFAEARLEMVGLDLSPQGPVTAPMLPGKPVSYYWKLSASEPGRFNGTLWLQLRLTPRDGGKDESIALLARQISFEARDFLGLPAVLVRWAGVAGAAGGAVLGFPLWEHAFTSAWRRIRRHQEE